MNKKIVLLIIIVLIIMILAIGGYLAMMMVNKKPLTINSNINTVNQPINNNGSVVNNNNNGGISNGMGKIIPEAENVKKDDKESISSLANIFTQHYGSYNNQLGFVNFDNISDFMTLKMKNWVLETYTTELSSKHPTSEFYTVTTKVLNINISVFDEAKNTAEVHVATQRQEFKKDNVTPDTFMQELLLNFVKEDNAWKVSGAYWQ